MNKIIPWLVAFGALLTVVIAYVVNANIPSPLVVSSSGTSTQPDNKSTSVDTTASTLPPLQEQSSTLSTATSTQLKVFKDTATYTSEKLGITFTYHTFGQPTAVLENNSIERGEAITGIHTRLYAPNNVYSYDPAKMLVRPNTSPSTTLKEWFHDHKDRTGVLLATSTFTYETLDNGIELLKLTGVYPPDYEVSEDFGGIVFARSPSGKYILELALAHGDRTPAEYKKIVYLMDIVSSLKEK